MEDYECPNCGVTRKAGSANCIVPWCSDHITAKKVEQTDEKGADFTRGYFCAVAALVNMHGSSSEVRDLIRCGGKPEKWVKLIDQEDYDTLMREGLVDPELVR